MNLDELLKMPPEELTRIINEASTKNDRWLFVALLIIGLVAVYFMTRYFMDVNKKLSDRVDQIQEQFQTHLTTQNQKMIEALAESKEVIRQNGVVLSELRTAIFNKQLKETSA